MEKFEMHRTQISSMLNQIGGIFTTRLSSSLMVETPWKTAVEEAIEFTEKHQDGLAVVPCWNWENLELVYVTHSGHDLFVKPVRDGFYNVEIDERSSIYTFIVDQLKISSCEN